MNAQSNNAETMVHGLLSERAFGGIQFTSKPFLHQPHFGLDGAGYERSDETYHRQFCGHNAALSPRPSYNVARYNRGSLPGDRHCDREVGANAAFVSKFHGGHFSVPSPEISSFIIQAGACRSARKNENRHSDSGVFFVVHSSRLACRQLDTYDAGIHDHRGGNPPH
jgi:hypothetical protein